MKLSLFKMNEKEIFKYLCSTLMKHYENIISMEDQFIYAVGTIPVMLVAHIDTVLTSPPKKIHFDKSVNAYWAENGLGADDRAGISAILDVVTDGYRPHILFCNHEEIGCIGAKHAVKNIKPNVNIIIELDRKGSEDFVTYDCENPKMDEWISKFGFKKSFGSYTDISVLCSQWKIGGVNLSIGYYNQHSPTEYLKIDEYYNSVKKLREILKAPPLEQFEYIEIERDLFDWGHEYYDEYNSSCEELYIDISSYEVEAYDTDGDVYWSEAFFIYNREIIEIAKNAAIAAIIASKEKLLLNKSHRFGTHKSVI